MVVARQAFLVSLLLISFCVQSLPKQALAAWPVRKSPTPQPVQIKILFPAYSGTFVQSAYLNVRGSLSNPRAIVFVNNVRAWVSGNVFYAYVPLKPGLNTLKATATGTLIIPASVSTTITRDNIAPNITISNISNGNWVNTPSFIVRGKLNEPGGISLNGIPYNVGGGYSFAASIRLKEDVNDLVLTARDRAGNTSSKTLRVCLDNTPPSKPTVRDAGAFTDTRTELIADWTAGIDAQSGIAEHHIAIVSTPAGQPAPAASAAPDVLAWTNPGQNGRFIARNLILSEGRTYYFLMRARNRAGGIGETAVSDGIVYRPPAKPPRIDGISVPAQTRLMEGNPIEIRVQATDPQSSPLSYRLMLNDVQTQAWTGSNPMRWVPDGAQFGVRRLKVEARNAQNLTASREAEVFIVRRPKQPPARSNP